MRSTAQREWLPKTERLKAITQSDMRKLSWRRRRRWSCGTRGPAGVEDDCSESAVDAGSLLAKKMTPQVRGVLVAAFVLKSLEGEAE